MTVRPFRILLVEDNRDLARSVAMNLEMEGYEVETAADGAAGLEAAVENHYDLLILDVMLPELDGCEVLSQVRSRGVEAPALMLTARGTEADKVRGFRAGADQYLTKPFGLLELLTRVETLLERRPGLGDSDVDRPFRLRTVEVDPAARTVRKEGEVVPLAPRAFDVLVALYRAEGRVLSRMELMRQVWGHKAAVVSRTVDVHVSQIRQAIEDDPSQPRHVVTVWKAGYRLVREAESKPR